MDQKTFNRVRLASIVLNEIEDLAPKMYPFLEFEKNKDESEGKYRLLPLVGEAKESQAIFSVKYQKWAVEVLDLLQRFYPQKVDEFTAAYQSALPYVTLELKPKMANSHKLKFEFTKYLTEQRTILSHLFAKVSAMEITDDECDMNEDVECGFTDNCLRVFRAAVQPVLETEINTFKANLSERNGDFKEIIDMADLINDAATNDVSKLINKCNSLRKLCAENVECEDAIRSLTPVFDIIGRM
ncbi:hypothetical protein [Methanococcoides burtonii]|uniref:Uncharacterized protein n=1 Tax=Methanococcoides burtonii (strain DSM 6242 / NBRC 107633 / OCM 468 / ACE-M) TaxID=259564 RepID=Q12VY5_METBU|nr:hypothetical protein [Methanococcoides burtonii]ABE52391.1 Hypothetical protein Mbur_1484 [Methanococcoides burtonii DSM 6242]